MAKKKEAATVEIHEMVSETAVFHLVGRTPFVCHAMSEKAKRELVLPKARVYGKAREATAKHDPLAEYRQSCYRSRGNSEPTRIVFPSSAFKKLLVSAAKETPGITGASINRLTWVHGWNTSMFGIPQMFMSVVRNSDANKTPDIRTRAIIPEWAATIEISYVTPNLRYQPIVNLLAAGGLMTGVGDGRVEKGALNFGQFEIVNPEDERFQRIIAEGGREAQDEALRSPAMYDIETEELYEWYTHEVVRRGFKVAS